MASAYVTGLLARRDAIAAELSTLNLTASQPGAKPNLTNTDGGSAIDHQGYKDALYRELKEIEDRLKNASTVDDALNGANDPFIFETRVIN